MTVLASINLSVDWEPVHNQGKRPTCLAFALSELNRCAHGASQLSPEYLYRAAARLIAGWHAGHGLFLDSALSAVTAPGQPTSLACPYLSDEPAEAPPALPVFAPENALLYATPATEMAADLQDVVAALSGGTPVGLVLKLTQTFFKPVNGMVDFAPTTLPGMNHAVVATGLGQHSTTGEPYIRIRNSWGPGWGDAGYAWLPHAYVEVHAVTAFKG